MIIHTDADDLDSMTGDCLLVLEISRKEIEDCNFTSSLERLMVLTETRDSTLRNQEALFIVITGYDHDSSELAEIPEIRAFFERLSVSWPHWLWFLSREEGMIRLLMSLLCSVNVHRQLGQFDIEFTDLTELDAKLTDLLLRGKALFDVYSIPVSLTKTSEASARSTFK